MGGVFFFMEYKGKKAFGIQKNGGISASLGKPWGFRVNRKGEAEGIKKKT